MPAIEPLVAALVENNLEVTTRAIHVLRELALGLDLETEEAARAALEEIASPRGTAAARRARETLNALDLLRQDRALAELKQLGAVIGEVQPVQAFGVTQQCGQRAPVKRLIGTGAAVLFKGNGFYQTDYRSESYKNSAKAEKDNGSKVASGDKKPDAKSTTSTEGKSTTDSAPKESSSSRSTARSTRPD